VAQDGGHEEVPGRARRLLVTDAVEQEQVCPEDLARQGESVPGREERVLRAVDDQVRRVA
jgi:hypothetical protein